MLVLVDCLNCSSVVKSAILGVQETSRQPTSSILGCIRRPMTLTC